jgi:hypothetical protein
MVVLCRVLTKKVFEKRRVHRLRYLVDQGVVRPQVLEKKKKVFEKRQVHRFREFVYQVVVHRRVLRVIVSLQRPPRQ